MQFSALQPAISTRNHLEVGTVWLMWKNSIQQSTPKAPGVEVDLENWYPDFKASKNKKGVFHCLFFSAFFEI